MGELLELYLVEMGWQAPLFMFTLHLSADEARIGRYSWPATSASPRPLAHTSLRHPGNRKVVVKKSNLNIKVLALELHQIVAELLKFSLGWKAH